jgi:hypothetical protein
MDIFFMQVILYLHLAIVNPGTGYEENRIFVIRTLG